MGNSITINREKLELLIEQVKNISKVEWGGGEVVGKTKDGKDIRQWPFPIYPDGLYESLYDLLGTDPNFSDNYAKIGKAPDYRGMSLFELRTVITALVRGERFCDGMIAQAIDSGDLLKILERIYEISSELDDAERINDNIPHSQINKSRDQFHIKPLKNVAYTVSNLIPMQQKGRSRHWMRQRAISCPEGVEQMTFSFPAVCLTN